MQHRLAEGTGGQLEDDTAAIATVGGDWATDHRRPVEVAQRIDDQSCDRLPPIVAGGPEVVENVLAERSRGIDQLEDGSLGVSAADAGRPVDCPVSP